MGAIPSTNTYTAEFGKAFMSIWSTYVYILTPFSLIRAVKNGNTTTPSYNSGLYAVNRTVKV
jgi:hypothetical protein